LNKLDASNIILNIGLNRRGRSILVFLFFLILYSSINAQYKSSYLSKILETPGINFPSSDNEFDISTLTPTFKWNKINNANGYTIYVDEIEGQSKSRIFESSEFGSISYTQYKFPDQIFSYGKTYTIIMRAFNTEGWSDYSEQLYFTVANSVQSKRKKLPVPTIITKNNLKIDSLANGDANYSLAWQKEMNVENFEIVIDGINSSTIFGEEYTNIISSSVVDTIYNLNPEMFSEFNNYRWRIRSKGTKGWSRFSPYHYFNITNNESEHVKNAYESEEIILRLKYGGFIDEMIVSQYKEGNVLLPVLEILSLLQLNHKLDLDNKILSGKRSDEASLDFQLKAHDLEFLLGVESLKLTELNFLESELEYFVNEEIFEKTTGLSAEVDMRDLTVELSADFNIPMVNRILNEKKLDLYKNSMADNSYPLMFKRQRKYLSGGFLDYAATANYINQQLPYYSLQLGMGGEFLGGDVQINSQQTFFDKKLTYNQVRYKWRYAFLNNDYISNISFGHNHTLGLQSYDFRGIKISNEPVEARRVYGSYKVKETAKPNWKVEIYHNNQLVDIVKTDDKGNYDFLIPFSYGTTLLELHEIGPNGEYNVETKMYQIPIEQIPKGRMDYSTNFGQLNNTDEYLFQGNAAYGITNWLTTKVGADIFTEDLQYSSFYSNTTARLFDGYIVNLTVAPNAFNELSLNTIFADLASFNFGVKLHDQNMKLNPTKINNELEGNIFIPLKIDDNMMSLLLRGRHTEYSGSKRSDFSLRTFYNYKNISPSVELNYYNLFNGSNNFESAYLNLRLNYSMYIPSAIFSGNIIDARFVYDIMNDKAQSMNFSVSSTVFNQFRVQLSHSTNFQNSNSDTQLRVVFDLPFIRSNTTVSKSVISHSLIGSVNYNEHLNEFNFYNRGMIGRSAATFKFFEDKNMNESFDEGEDLVPDMDVQINSIGSKRRINEGNIIINDLEAYSKYDVKLVDRYNKNPLWFPYKEKFSFVSDPHQYKEIEIPFYEAAEVSGSVLKRSNMNLVPISGLNVIFEHFETKEITKVRTMSDGSFYHYGIQPGEYNIYIDGSQLERLKVKSIPNKIDKLINSISIAEEMIEFNFVLE
jgi:hypothetical protein